MKSDTPRTESARQQYYRDVYENTKGFSVSEPVHADFARELEREIAEERELLKEMYVFVAMRHKATQPWRNALDEWQKKVEALTGWNDYETIQDWRKNK